MHIVEDDDAVRGSLTLLVEACGWTAKPFASAEEFLQADAVLRHDCVIIDLQMPGMDGVMLAEKLHAQDSSLRIVFITAGEDPHLVNAAKALKSAQVLDKPFRESALIKALESPFTEQ